MNAHQRRISARAQAVINTATLAALGEVYPVGSHVVNKETGSTAEVLFVTLGEDAKPVPSLYVKRRDNRKVVWPCDHVEKVAPALHAVAA